MDEGTIAEFLCRQFGLVPVAAAYLYTGKAQLADGTPWH
jgi:hypothetical protein